MKKERTVGGGGKMDNLTFVKGNRSLDELDSTSVKNLNAGAGTSIFDPTLCELVYTWFNVANGAILDPFAGGSVRGIIAAKLGQHYTGNDLRSEQIDANYANAKEVLSDSDVMPIWTIGDSLDIDRIVGDRTFDLLFSCPPYADLEVYSDLENDISNMPYNEFLTIYREIIQKSYALLKENRFAIFVVGEVRSRHGEYYNFVGDTIKAFLDCGAKFYNDIILLNTAGSLPLRVGRQFNSGRKIGKCHQNVLVFFKGDTKNIKEIFGDVVVEQDGESLEEL
mgnify:FL=1